MFEREETTCSREDVTLCQFQQSFLCTTTCNRPCKILLLWLLFLVLQACSMLRRASGSVSSTPSPWQPISAHRDRWNSFSSCTPILKICSSPLVRHTAGLRGRVGLITSSIHRVGRFPSSGTPTFSSYVNP